MRSAYRLIGICLGFQRVAIKVRVKGAVVCTVISDPGNKGGKVCAFVTDIGLAGIRTIRMEVENSVVNARGLTKNVRVVYISGYLKLGLEEEGQ
jgi:hypothetical protein